MSYYIGYTTQSCALNAHVSVLQCVAACLVYCLVRQMECIVLSSQFCSELTFGECLLAANGSCTLQRAASHATHCNTLQHTATRCITVQHTATHCTLRCRKLQYTLHELNQRQLSAVCPHTADILNQRTATHCNALQHTAKHCHTLQIYCMRCSMSTYGVVTISRLLKIIGLFCKRAR